MLLPLANDSQLLWPLRFYRFLLVTSLLSNPLCPLPPEKQWNTRPTFLRPGTLGATLVSTTEWHRPLHHLLVFLLVSMFLLSLQLSLNVPCPSQCPYTESLCLWFNGPTHSHAYCQPPPRKSHDCHVPWAERWSLKGWLERISKSTYRAIPSGYLCGSSFLLVYLFYVCFYQQPSIVSLGNSYINI